MYSMCFSMWRQSINVSLSVCELRSCSSACGLWLLLRQLRCSHFQWPCSCTTSCNFPTGSSFIGAEEQQDGCCTMSHKIGGPSAWHEWLFPPARGLNWCCIAKETQYLVNALSKESVTSEPAKGNEGRPYHFVIASNKTQLSTLQTFEGLPQFWCTPVMRSKCKNPSETGETSKKPAQSGALHFVTPLPGKE